MAQDIQTLNMDINQNVGEIFTMKQGDTLSRFLQITLSDNGAAINLTDNTVRIYIKKPDGTKVYNDATIVTAASGVVKVEFTSQALAAAGSLECELTIGGLDGSILTSKGFYVTVDKVIRDDAAIESSDEFGFIATALNIVNGTSINEAARVAAEAARVTQFNGIVATFQDLTLIDAGTF